MKKHKRNKYISIDDNIPHHIEFNSLLDIKTTKVTANTHGFHKYPSKFIPQIPRWAIENHLSGKQGKLVFDPFSGSGTTLVEGILAGHHVLGIDIDPFASLIAKVKITSVNKNKLIQVIQWLKKSLRLRKTGSFQPECETIQHWFSEDAINKLSIIRSLIDEIPNKFGSENSIPDIRELLIVCLSSIIRRVSNADNQSQKTYVSHTNPKSPEEVFDLFLRRMELYKERIIDFSDITNPALKREVKCFNSAVGISSNLNGSKIDLAISSPPYIKAIDYIYNQMAELFWIGDIFNLQTQTQQNKVKNNYIGTKMYMKNVYSNYSPYELTFGIDDLDLSLQKVFSIDFRNGCKHSFIAYRYFTQMKEHFIQMKKFLRPKTHYVMVVGNSSVSGIEFETSDFLTQIALQNGFDLTNKWAYKIKNHYMRFDRKGRGGKINTDWVLDFTRNREK